MKKTKKMIIAGSSVLLVALIAVGGYSFASARTPVNFISLDINPSVELGINASDEVVTVEGVNDDGKTIIEGQDLINNNVTDAIDKLVESAVDNNFIVDDGSTVIAITAESDDPAKAEELQDAGEQAANDAIVEKEVVASVYTDCSDLSLRKEAKELGISPGKYKMFKTILALDPTVTVDQLKNQKVSEIVKKAKEIIAANPELANGTVTDETKAKALEKLKDAVTKSEEKIKVAEENKAIREAANTKSEELKKAANVQLNEANAKAEEIKKTAETQAAELRKQADQLLADTTGMTEEQIAELKAKADALRAQADALVAQAKTDAQQVTTAAQAQHKEAIAQANQVKEDARNQIKETMKKEIEAKKQEQEQKREEKKNEQKNNDKSKAPETSVATSGTASIAENNVEQSAVDKEVAEIKREAEEKATELKKQAEEKQKQAEKEAAELKKQAESKQQVDASKAEELKKQAEQKKIEAAQKAEELKKQAEEKAAQAREKSAKSK